MALVDETGSDNTARFVKIINGSLCLKSQTQLNDKYEIFKTKNPETEAPVEYYVRKFKRVVGKVDKLERVELTDKKIFGYNLHMIDEDGPFQVFFRDDSPITTRLLKVFENVNLDEDLEIRVFKGDDGKNGVAFSQNGVNVPQKWYRNGEEGNLPEPRKVKGKWNYSAIDEFLYNNAMENIIPQFVQQESVPETTGQVEDDLNF